MTDRISPAKRSALMSKVRNRNTAPEMTVRRILHRMGYRFRLHSNKLAGHPDIILPRHHKVIFVHGCFWHGHDCPRGKRPTSNVEFWNRKLDHNIERDRLVFSALIEAGWQVLVVWQCQTKNALRLEQILTEFMLMKP